MLNAILSSYRKWFEMSQVRGYIVKNMDAEGFGRKNFKQRTQSPLKSAARAAGPATVYALEL
jgi:hypothetical protein